MNIEDIIKAKAEFPIYKKAIINLLYSEKWITDKINSELKTYDISIQQFNVLRILKGQNGKPANLSTIQERMVSKMSNTTRLVDKLKKKNLVARVTCPSNRRKVEITITKEGISFLDKVNNVMDSLEKEITVSLSITELEQLNKLLNKLRD